MEVADLVVKKLEVNIYSNHTEKEVIYHER